MVVLRYMQRFLGVNRSSVDKVELGFKMNTCTVNRDMAKLKLKGSMTRWTTGRIDKKNGEEGWTPIYKLALLQLVESAKIFSKDIIKVRLLKLKDVLRVLVRGQHQCLQTTKWVNTKLFHGQLKGWKRWNWLGRKHIQGTYRLKAFNLFLV